MEKRELKMRTKYEVKIYKDEWSEVFKTHNVGIGVDIVMSLYCNFFPQIQICTFKDVNAENYVYSKNLQKEIHLVIDSLNDAKKYLKKKNLPPINDKYK